MLKQLKFFNLCCILIFINGDFHLTRPELMKVKRKVFLVYTLRIASLKAPAVRFLQNLGLRWSFINSISLPLYFNSMYWGNRRLRICLYGKHCFSNTIWGCSSTLFNERLNMRFFLLLLRLLLLVAAAYNYWLVMLVLMGTERVLRINENFIARTGRIDWNRSIAFSPLLKMIIFLPRSYVGLAL